MAKNNKDAKEATKPKVEVNFFDYFWEESWTYIKTVVDVVREPILILDNNLHVMTANEPFYQIFNEKPKNTESKLIYELGNGQWDIPALHKLLESVIYENTFFKGFQVAHDFPSVGRKVIILNARQIYLKNTSSREVSPPIILLAMEDVTEMMSVAKKLANHTKEMESKLTARTQKLETQILALDKEISELKKKTKK